MFIATCDTVNFSFIAAGHTTEEAVDNLTLGLDKHATQYRLTRAWSAGLDIRIAEIPEGGCLRDNELIR